MEEQHATIAGNRFNRAALRVVTAILIVGTLDLVYVLGVNAANGVPPAGVLQYIASGILGVAAFEGGAGAALLGIVSHFALMAVFAGGVAFAVGLPGVRRLHPVIPGLCAGAALYVVMNFIVVPLSRTPELPPLAPGRLILEIAVHVVFIGPIVAWIIAGRRFASGASSPVAPTKALKQ